MPFIGIFFHLEPAFQTFDEILITRSWHLPAYLHSPALLILEIDHPFFVCLGFLSPQNCKLICHLKNKPTYQKPIILWVTMVLIYLWDYTGFFSLEKLFHSMFDLVISNHMEWNHMWNNTRKRERGCTKYILSREVREEQRRASLTGKGKMIDWTWEDNEEWNTVQQNVISQTLVRGALLPFLWDCYYRWISPTKTSIPWYSISWILQWYRQPLKNWALKAGVSSNDARFGIVMKVQWDWSSHVYPQIKTVCYEHFSLMQVFSSQR